jgi:aconitate hydratase
MQSEVFMRGSLTYQLLESHLLEGELKPGSDIKIKVDQTLTQDATGTMVYLQCIALGLKKVKTECSVAYIDHNTLQSGFENADDHIFIQTAAARYGIIFSKAGNGICHQLHLERFARPGAVLIGSDSHTPTCGGMGMLAFGAGGLDVAVGMAKGYYRLKVPLVYGIYMTGSLKPWVSAKDVILKVLEQLTVKGGVGYVLEYHGPGVANLTLTDRATITNMGAELGATTSIFASDQVTYDYLLRQGRANVFEASQPEQSVQYHKTLVIDLNALEPLVALPHSPDHVKTVQSCAGLRVDQVAIGSCTNASYTDLMRVARILKGKRIADHVSLVISPGSSNVLKMIADSGALGTMIAAGARILEAACGPCIGMGQAPGSDAVSLRTYNRNFKGRCGTESAGVYLVSPETAAISALNGVLSSPETLVYDGEVELPGVFDVQEGYFVYPDLLQNPEIVMGPNIKPFPVAKPLMEVLEGKVLIKLGDHITTDDIVPSSATLLPLRSNVPALSHHCFKTKVQDFYERCRNANGGIILGGDNYGQGSSREHAALVPLYLGVSAVVAKSFARIHKANLINAGIVPLVFINQEDYNHVMEGDTLQLEALSSLQVGKPWPIKHSGSERPIFVQLDGMHEDWEIIKKGGMISFLKGEEIC